MATRYLTALDYSDLHTNAVLRKHAKKRPLGELETRYQYTPPQPVLSCRTVDIDVSGTRTYRPRSTADILDEQHRLVHKLFTAAGAAGRTAASAPPRRSSPRKVLGQIINGTPAVTAKGKGAVHVQGRLYTAMSQASSEAAGLRIKTSSPGHRSKSTGRLRNVKPATDTYQASDFDEEDLLETRRSHSELTNQLHDYWKPESCNLNQGHFMRGQKRPDDVPPTLDAWLTFGGAGGGAERAGGDGDRGSGGVVDAFANFHSPDDYYNIEGSVGSRVAQQLQKGDRIRIGINGEVISHDLRLKKLARTPDLSCPQAKEQQPLQDVSLEEAQQGDGKEATERSSSQGQSVSPEIQPKGSSAAETPQQEPGIDDLFGDMTFQPLEQAMMEKQPEAPGADTPRSGVTDSPRRPKAAALDLPLSWEDQVSRPEVKVIQARLTPRDQAKENLCETHPVVFNRVVRSTCQRPRLASAATTTAAVHGGYSLKQRTAGDARLEASKVKTISINPNSPEDEQRLSSISVDDVIQKRLEKNDSSTAASEGAPGAARSVKAAAGEHGEGPEDAADGLPRSGVHKSRKRSTSAASRNSSSRSSSGAGIEAGAAAAGTVGRTSGRIPPSHFSSPAPGGRPWGVPAAQPSSSVPSFPRDLASDLGIVVPVGTSLGVSGSSCVNGRGMGGGGLERHIEKPSRQLTALPLYRGPGAPGSSVSSINSGPVPGDTAFIQISQPIRNPNSASTTTTTATNTNNNIPPSFASHPHPPTFQYVQRHSSSSPAPCTPRPPPLSPADSPSPENGVQYSLGNRTPSLQRSLSPRDRPDPPTTPDLNLSGGDTPPEEEFVEVVPALGRPSSVGSSSASGPSAVRAINIPTGDHVEDEDEEEELTGAQRRERNLRDQQIEHITNMLEGAILSADNQ